MIPPTLILDVNRGYISPAEAAQKARKYALIAEKLRPGCGEVSSLMGIIYYLNSEFEKAAPYFERSLEVSPNYYMTNHTILSCPYFQYVMEDGLVNYEKYLKS